MRVFLCMIAIPLPPVHGGVCRELVEPGTRDDHRGHPEDRFMIPATASNRT
jgi:hypothetical protein